MTDLGWYWRRLSAMGPAEILWRGRQWLRQRRQRRQVARGRLPVPAEVDLGALPAWSLPDDLVDDADRRALIAECSDALSHRWRFFDVDLVEPEIDWLADPLAGKAAPAVFSPSCPHKDWQRIGDIKITWEKNRHHHLSLLAVGYAVTGDEAYAAEVEAQLESWLAQNPCLIGPNWHHLLEHGVRLIAWVWVERLLRGSPQHARLFAVGKPIWTAIWQQQLLIAEGFSQGTSANNHLIGELAGLYISSLAWPVFPESARWAGFAQRRLESELPRQTFASGINRELGFDYQLFVLEFGLLALSEARRAGIGLAPRLVGCLRQKAEVVARLRSFGPLPRFGDGDDGLAVQLQARSADRVTALLAVAAHACGAGCQIDRVPLMARLLGVPARPAGLAEGAEDRGQQSDDGTHFVCADAGLYLLRRSWSNGELSWLADVGPHGYLAIAAHAHADALSMVLQLAGQPFLVDPGTYCYHTDLDWRNFFRGTAAHNTLCIDGADQAVSGGPFLWQTRPTTSVNQWDPAAGVLQAEHDGYQRWDLLHRRRWQFDIDELLIEDEVSGAGNHQLVLHWHCHPDVQVEELGPGRLVLRVGAKALQLDLPGQGEWGVFREGMRVLGDADAGGLIGFLGWYSPHFRVKQAAATIRWQANLNVPIKLQTRIRPG